MRLHVVSLITFYIQLFRFVRTSQGEWYYTSTMKFVVKNSTKRYSGATMTSCQLKCKNVPDCERVGWVKQPLLGLAGDCYLLTKGWDSVETTGDEKNGEILLQIMETQTYPPGCKDKDSNVLQEECSPPLRATVPPTTTTTTTTTITTTKAPDVNIAQGKVTTINSKGSEPTQFTNGNFVDTAFTGRSASSTYPFIMIDLGAVATISKIRIYTDKARITFILNSKIYKTDSNGNTLSVCGTVASGTNIPYTVNAQFVYFDVVCPTNPPFAARFVKVRIETYSQFITASEVEVYGKPLVS